MGSTTAPVHDARQSTHGLPQVFTYLLLVAAVLFTWRAIVATSVGFARGDLLAASTTLASAALWVTGSIGVFHNGQRMRILAWVSWVANIVIPLLTFPADAFYYRVSPYYHLGATYYYLPIVASIAALAWLWWSEPSRIAERNGG